MVQEPNGTILRNANKKVEFFFLASSALCRSFETFKFAQGLL